MTIEELEKENAELKARLEKLEKRINKQRQYQRNYYLSHRDECKQRSIEWEKNHRELVTSRTRQYKHDYYMKNREHLLKLANNRYRIKCGLKPID